MTESRHAYEIKQSRDYQKSFDFYFIALEFAVLSLAIQYPLQAADFYLQIAEVVSWFCIFCSGLAGLARMEWKPQLIAYAGEIAWWEDSRSATQVLLAKGHQGFVDQATGQTRSLKATLDYEQGRIDQSKEIYDRLERKHGLLYQFQKIGFLLGVFLLVLAKSIEHLN